MSEFKNCERLAHAKDWLIFSKNIGNRLFINEVALCLGEFYTIISNKKAKGRAGSIIAIIKGTVSSDVIRIVKKNHRI